MAGCVQASDNTRAVGQEAGERVPADQTRRVILCSGQIYYRLFHARRARQIRDIILVRLEQIAPFPHDLVTQVLAASLFPPCSLLKEQPMSASASCLKAPGALVTLVLLACATLKRPSQVRHGCP